MLLTIDPLPHGRDTEFATKSPTETLERNQNRRCFKCVPLIHHPAEKRSVEASIADPRLRDSTGLRADKLSNKVCLNAHLHRLPGLHPPCCLIGELLL